MNKKLYFIPAEKYESENIIRDNSVPIMAHGCIRFYKENEVIAPEEIQFICEALTFVNAKFQENPKMYSNIIRKLKGES